MGLFRKMTSVSTLGMVDFKSDKERIANSTRKGMKVQKEMLAEMRKANAAQGIAPTELNRWGAIGDRQANHVVSTAQATAAQGATAPSGPPPGWYDDNQDSTRSRWWDGASWTDHTRSKE